MCSILSVREEPPPRPLAELESEICQLAGHLAAATCRWLLLVAEFDARNGWAECGVLSCAHWLSWRCGIGLIAAREHTRVARMLGQLPLVREAFARGELSYCKVRAITRVASGATEADLVELARHATGAQLERLVRSFRGALRATTASVLETHQLQRLDLHWDEQGMLCVEGRLTAEDGALLVAAIEAAKEEVPEFAREQGMGAPAQRAQALMALARGAAKPCEMVVHVDVETLAGDEASPDSGVPGGPVLAPETVRRLGCDASVVRIVERDGQPLSVGRRTRTISRALRRALRRRDGGGCRFPGCTHTRYLHAHHVKHWARGGRTDLGNLVQLCSRHHRLVHEGGYAVELEHSGAPRFRAPNGALIPDTGPCATLRGPGVARQNDARRLGIGPNTCRPLSAGDRLDYDIAVEGLLRRELPPDQP